MICGVSGLKRVKDASKKMPMYSKCWVPGDTMRIVFPVGKNEDGDWDLIGGGIWGHKVNDFEGVGLKTAFIPSLTEFDDNGDPIGTPDITYQFSKIAPVFVRGMKEEDMAKVLKKSYPTEAARTEAIRKIDHKYDTKNNMKAIKPAIASVGFMITTEVLCYKCVDDKPVLDSAMVVSFPLASQRIDQLMLLLKDPKFAPNEGDSFWEIEWKYGVDSDKSKSAKTSNPAGLTADYRTANTDPDIWKKLETFMQQIATDPALIVKRATKSISEASIRSALTAYSFLNSEYIDLATEEDVDLLCRNTKIIKELGFMRTLSNEDVIGKINEAFAEIKQDVPEEVPNVTIEPQSQPAPSPVETAPSTSPLISDDILNPDAPNLGDLLKGNISSMSNSSSFLDISEDELETI